MNGRHPLDNAPADGGGHGSQHEFADPPDQRAGGGRDTHAARGSTRLRGTGETGRNAYLSAIDGLAFGDDPSQGVVRDNAFIHPKLGFAFLAPDGFTLDNQSAALIGVGESGTQALRLDSIEAPSSQTLEQALASGWIDGVQTNSIETLKDVDLPTAVAIAKGEQWTFRLAAIRLGSRIYRLIFAAHSLSGATDARFMTAIRSFHRITNDENGLARQAHVRTVTAQPGDDSASLATPVGAPPA